MSGPSRWLGVLGRSGRRAASWPAHEFREVLPGLPDPLLDFVGVGEFALGQVAQHRAVEGGGELDGQHIQVDPAEAQLRPNRRNTVPLPSPARSASPSMVGRAGPCPASIWRAVVSR